MNNQLILNQLINILPQYILWKDKDGIFRGCNLAFAEQFGFKSEKDVIGKTDYDFNWPRELSDKYTADDQEIIQKGEPKLKYEEEQKQPDGSIKIVLVNKVPIREGKDIVGVLATYFDITDTKRRIELEKHQAILDEKIKVLQLMGGAVAHELRTPLATISLAAQAVESILPALFKAYHLAVDNKLMQPVAQEARFKLMETVFDNIKEEVKASNVFIDNMLLNIQNLAADPRDMEVLSMQKCIEDAITRFPFDERPRQFTHVKVDYDFLFRGMPVLMQHVIFNLLRNGIYYVLESSKDDAGIYIWTERGEDGWNILHFKDTGTGISEEHMKHVFERFFSKRYHGTGVGLAFCKQVLTQFGGTITCDAKEGEYTHFIMRFPPVDEKKELIQG